jgi:hypothetical protein
MRHIVHKHFVVDEKKKLTYCSLLFVSIAVFSWLLKIPYISTSILFLFTEIGKYIFLKPWGFTRALEIFATPVVEKPIWMIIIQIIGYISFLGLGLLGLIWTFLEKTFTKNQFVDQRVHIDTIGLLLTAAILALPYLIGFELFYDLMWRSLLFIYLALAPLVAKSLIIINNYVIKVKFFKLLGRFLIIAVLACIIQNAIYSGIYYHHYDNSAEMQPEDTRLNLVQWISLADYTKKYINSDIMYGVRLANNLVGSLGKKNIIQIAGINIVPGSQIIRPSDFVIEKGQIFILRKSLVTVPEQKNYTFSQKELDTILDRFNIIYQSQDPFIITR